MWLAPLPKPTFLRKLSIGAPKPSNSSRPPNKLHHVPESDQIIDEHVRRVWPSCQHANTSMMLSQNPDGRYIRTPTMGPHGLEPFTRANYFGHFPIHTLNRTIPMLKRRCHHASNLRLSDRPYAPYSILDMPCKSSCQNPSGLEAFAMFVVCSVM